MILVVGGAGYIGSHFVQELIDTKEVLIIDNLSTGNEWAIHSKAKFEQGSILDEQFLISVFNMYKIDAVVHFAAFSLVGESVNNPMKYYENNVTGTLNLLKVMNKYDVNKIIFSSTAAVYGMAEAESINEETLAAPINPYGKTKYIVEQMLQDFSRSYGLKYVVLRYFNAAGASSDSSIGECHFPETHLIPLVLQHLLGQKECIKVYGNDYDTPDGTCIRDYIHVEDLAKAHHVSLNYLLEAKIEKEVFNLGNGDGHSVKEVIEMCEIVTNKKANIIIEDRRLGDPSRLVANSNRIFSTVGWKAEKDLRAIVESAYTWHCKNQ